MATRADPRHRPRMRQTETGPALQVGEGARAGAVAFATTGGETGSLAGLSVTEVGDLSQNLRAPAQEDETDCKECIRSPASERLQSIE